MRLGYDPVELLREMSEQADERMRIRARQAALQRRESDVQEEILSTLIAILGELRSRQAPSPTPTEKR